MFESLSMEKRIRCQLESRSKEELIAARDQAILKDHPLGPDFLKLIQEVLAKKYLVNS